MPCMACSSVGMCSKPGGTEALPLAGAADSDGAAGAGCTVAVCAVAVLAARLSSIADKNNVRAMCAFFIAYSRYGRFAAEAAFLNEEHYLCHAPFVIF